MIKNDCARGSQPLLLGGGSGTKKLLESLIATVVTSGTSKEVIVALTFNVVP